MTDTTIIEHNGQRFRMTGEVRAPNRGEWYITMGGGVYQAATGFGGGQYSLLAPIDDPVTAPAHYRQGGVECWDAIAAIVVGYSPQEAALIGPLVKYLWRAPHKGTKAQDLRKAREYFDRLLAKETT